MGILSLSSLDSQVCWWALVAIVFYSFLIYLLRIPSLHTEALSPVPGCCPNRRNGSPQRPHHRSHLEPRQGLWIPQERPPLITDLTTQQANQLYNKWINDQQANQPHGGLIDDTASQWTNTTSESTTSRPINHMAGYRRYSKPMGKLMSWWSTWRANWRCRGPIYNAAALSMIRKAHWQCRWPNKDAG